MSSPNNFRHKVVTGGIRPAEGEGICQGMTTYQGLETTRHPWQPLPSHWVKTWVCFKPSTSSSLRRKRGLTTTRPTPRPSSLTVLRHQSKTRRTQSAYNRWCSHQLLVGSKSELMRWHVIDTSVAHILPLPKVTSNFNKALCTARLYTLHTWILLLYFHWLF